MKTNQIIHGNAWDVLQEIPDNSIDLVVTDPPYKVSQNYGGGTDPDNLMNVASILKIIPELSRVLKDGRFAVFFYDNRILPFLFEGVRGTELCYKKSIYLYRRWGNANRWMGWMQCTDPICFFVKGHDKPLHVDVKGKVKHDCYIKKSPERIETGHPAQKPLQILKDIIFWCSNKGDIILDPYCGSGTTIIAAEQLERKFIGIEIEQKYVDITNHNRQLYSKNTLDNLCVSPKELT